MIHPHVELERRECGSRKREGLQLDAHNLFGAHVLPAIIAELDPLLDVLVWIVELACLLIWDTEELDQRFAFARLARFAECESVAHLLQ